MSDSCKIPQEECARFIDEQLKTGDAVSAQQLYERLEAKYHWVATNCPDLKNESINQNINWRYQAVQGYGQALKTGMRRIRALLSTYNVTLITTEYEANRKQLVYKYSKAGFSVFEQNNSPKISQKDKIKSLIDAFQKKQNKSIKKVKHKSLEQPVNAYRTKSYYDKLIEKLKQLKSQELAKNALDTMMYVEGLADSKPDNWMKKCRESLSLALSNIKGEIPPLQYALYLKFYAEFLVRFNLYEDAEKLYIEAISLYENRLEKLKNNIDFVVDYLELKECLAMLLNEYHRYDDAIDIVENILTYIENCGKSIDDSSVLSSLSVECYHTLAISYNCKNDPEKAFRYALHALDLEDSLNVKPSLRTAGILYSMSDIYFKNVSSVDDWESAESYIEQAVDILKEMVETEHVGYGLFIKVLSQQASIYSNTPLRFKDENFCKDNKYAINNVKKLYEDCISMCRQLATDNPYKYNPILADTIRSYLQMRSIYAFSLNEVSKALMLGQEAAEIYDELSIDNPSIYACDYSHLFYVEAASIEKYLDWNAWKLSQGDKEHIECFYTLSEIQLSFLNETKDLLNSINTLNYYDETIAHIDDKINRLYCSIEEFEEFLQDRYTPNNI